MEEKIERYCETCKVRLITKAAHDRCFNLNHNIRVHGHFIVPCEGGGTFSATALNDAKAGDTVLIKL